MTINKVKIRKRRHLVRQTVIAVALDLKSAMFRCHAGHEFWEPLTVGKGRLKQPMNTAMVKFFSRYWGPGQGCTGRCHKCEKLKAV